MKYHVFNKKPSQADVEAATKCSSDPQEQMETLALATFPEKNELWQNINTGRVIVIRSQHIPIQGTGAETAIDCCGVVVADVIGSEVDFDIFKSWRKLKNMSKSTSLPITSATTTPKTSMASTSSPVGVP